MSSLSTPGVRFDGVWKKFRRGQVHDSLRDLIPSVARRLVKKPKVDDGSLTKREFWALRDISFDVQPGEAMGIIGANGAGKSTVLKTLNRILRPTFGVAEIRGRAGALIEISAGFHQDLTGAENIFLQGAIMGMRKAETARKFDQIVEFSGIADFIETPVKRYSSGMQARLGFSIAAHLDPEVLIIDEVLAVGDLAFQERAFGRISEMVKSGIPVVLVSHQLDRVATLCTKGLLLEKGEVRMAGTAAECIAEYVLKPAMAGGAEAGSACPVRLTGVDIESELPVSSGSRVRLRMRGEADDDAYCKFDPYNIAVRSAQTGSLVFRMQGANLGLPCPSTGRFETELELQLNVPAGIYAFETEITDVSTGIQVAHGPVVYVQVTDGPPFEGSVQMNPTFRTIAM